MLLDYVRRYKVQRHYSYFLVKPDGIKRLDEICDEIEKKFQSVMYYAVEDFEISVEVRDDDVEVQ